MSLQMLTKIIFMFLITNASKEDAKAENFFFSGDFPFSLLFSDRKSSLFVIFSFLDFAEFYRFVCASKKILQTMPEFLELTGFKPEIRAFFGVTHHYFTWHLVGLLNIPLFLKFKAFPEVFHVQMSAKALGEKFEFQNDCVKIKIDEDGYFDVLKPNAIPMLYSFTLEGQTFNLDKISLPNLSVLCGEMNTLRKLPFQVYVTYKTETGADLQITYPCEKKFPFVMKDEDISFFSRYFFNEEHENALYALGTKSSIEEIPNIANKKYIQDPDVPELIEKLEAKRAKNKRSSFCLII